MECFLCFDYFTTDCLDLAKGRLTACCHNWTCGTCLDWLAGSTTDCLNCYKTMTWSEGSGCSVEELDKLYTSLMEQRQAMEQFYLETKAVPWCLDDKVIDFANDFVNGQSSLNLATRPDISQSNPMWSQHYQAEIKAFDLAQAQLATLLKLSRTSSQLLATITPPQYQFHRPGVLITNSDGRQAVVTDYYGFGSGEVVRLQFRAMLQTIFDKLAQKPDLVGKSDQIGLVKENIMSQLSSHPRTHWGLVSSNLDLSWNWYQLSKNANFTPQLMNEQAYFSWSVQGLVQNRHCTLDILERLAQGLIKNRAGVLNGYRVSHNINLTWAWVMQHSEIQWDYRILGANPAIKFQDVNNGADLAYRNQQLTYNQRADLILGFSENPGVIEELVAMNPQFSWDAFLLTKNRNISWRFISQRLDWEWNWWWLAGSAKIDWEIFHSHRNKLSSIRQLSGNDNITWDLVVNNLQIGWDLKELSRNVNVGWQVIKACKGLSELTGKEEDDWQWNRVTLNSNVNLVKIKEGVELGIEWDWANIFSNLMNVELVRAGWWEK